jgi:predicted component of type VI protein secretion system
MLRVSVSMRGKVVDHHELSGPRVTIGRAPESTIYLNNPLLSRRHAAIVRTPVGWELRDTGSRNGLYVNGVRKTRHLLNDGDRLAVGKFLLEVGCDGPPAAAARFSPNADYLGQGRTLMLPVAGEAKPLPPAPAAYISVSAPNPAVYVMRNDVFRIGSGRACDLRLRGLLAFRAAALIVRGRAGFCLVNVSPQPDGVYHNGIPVGSRCWLNDGDKLEVGPLFARFRAGPLPKLTRRASP